MFYLGPSRQQHLDGPRVPSLWGKDQRSLTGLARGIQHERRRVQLHLNQDTYTGSVTDQDNFPATGIVTSYDQS